MILEHPALTTEKYSCPRSDRPVGGSVNRLHLHDLNHKLRMLLSYLV